MTPPRSHRLTRQGLVMSKRQWISAATLLCLGALSAHAAAATPLAAKPAPAPDGLQGAEVEAMFSPQADPAQRQAAMKRAVQLAMAGDGRAAFDLGVLYRHGMDHPAQAVERDLDTARHWLETCVGLEACPNLVLASLAELELQAGREKPAVQWALAWVALERELQKRGPKASSRDTSAYEAYLLSRCFERMPKAQRDQLTATWHVNSWRSAARNSIECLISTPGHSMASNPAPCRKSTRAAT